VIHVIGSITAYCPSTSISGALVAPEGALMFIYHNASITFIRPISAIVAFARLARGLNGSTPVRHKALGSSAAGAPIDPMMDWNRKNRGPFG
jgi:hypothetical protein